MDLQSRFVAVREFLKSHQELWESEVLNHYPKGLPAPYQEWVKELRGLSPKQLIEIECHGQGKSLVHAPRAFLEEVSDLSKLPELSLAQEPLPEEVERGMGQKKRHEARAIKSFLKEKTYRSFVDIGSGKGHLSMALLAKMEGESLCVDMDPKLQEAGRKKMRSHCPDMLERIRYENLFFDAKAQLAPVPGALLLGLHACGDLSVEIMDFHLKKERDLLSFGCCYHKSSRFNLSSLAKSDPLELSFHGLTLATRANRSLGEVEFSRRQKVKLYRYILHMILVDELGEDFSPTGSAHYTDYSLPFRDYCAKHAPRSKELDLESLFAKYASSDMLADYLLSETFRAPLGRLLEIYLLLDRALYLEERGSKVELRTFFDSELSPRNIGIFSLSN